MDECQYYATDDVPSPAQLNVEKFSAQVTEYIRIPKESQRQNAGWAYLSISEHAKEWKIQLPTAASAHPIWIHPDSFHYGRQQSAAEG